MKTTVASRAYGETPSESSGVLVAGFVAAGAVVAGVGAGHFMATGREAAVLALSLALLPVLLWKKPELGPAVLVIAALAVEQFDHFYALGPGVAALTTRIPLFHGLSVLPANPADLLVCLLLAIYIAKSGTEAVGPWPRSPIGTAVFCLLAAVVLGVGVGIAHGGETRVAFMEARPYVYLASAFVLASVLLTTRTAVRAVLWGFVVAVAFKAGQGLLVFLSVRHLPRRPEAVLGHEEALFFTLFLLLAVALWLFEVSGAMRTTVTLLVPVVLAADLANQRRSAWLLLIAGLVALSVVAFVALPGRRKVLARILVGIVLAAAFYLPAYWDRTGGFAQPARAIRSAVAPTPRDEASNLYRIQENANLLFNIGQAGPLGKGFGVPIDYALPIVDISDINPFIAYIPHNGGLYLLMRIGVLGAVAFWAMLGIAIIAACRLAKSADREIAMVGALIMAGLVAYVFMGHVDQGFFFYRIALVVGTLLGLAEAARRLSAPGVPRPGASAASALEGSVRP